MKSSRLAETGSGGAKPAEDALVERLGLLDQDRCLSWEEFQALSDTHRIKNVTAFKYFLFHLFCQISRDRDPTTVSEKTREHQRRFLNEIWRGESAEEAKDLFINCLEISPRLGPASVFRRRPPMITDLAQRARDYIDRHFASPLSLQTIARELSVSKEHLSRLFKRRFQTTITDYLHRRRVARAKTLMRKGRTSLKGICFEVGYRNYNDFYRHFRKYEKVSPKTFQTRP